jgi:hypothetical protein
VRNAGCATFGCETRGFHAFPNTAKEFPAFRRGRRFLAAREGDNMNVCGISGFWSGQPADRWIGGVLNGSSGIKAVLRIQVSA